MKIIVNYDQSVFPPLISLAIYDAPHRRMHVRTLQHFREELRKAFTKIGVLTPIDGPVDVRVNFVNPTSPDFDNLLTALYRAMDGKALKGPGILTDDGNIQAMVLRKFFNK
jgi:Holliday junction resolvase RusA-like endonuclease